MRRIAVVIGLIILFTTCKWDKGEKADVIPSLRLFPGVSSIYGQHATLTSDSCVILCGNRNNKILVIKLTLQGDVVWERTIGLSEHTAVAVNALGDGAMIAANFNYASFGTAGIRSIGIDGNGDSLFARVVSYTTPAEQVFDMTNMQMAVLSGTSTVVVISLNANGSINNYHGLLVNGGATVNSIGYNSAGTNLIGSNSGVMSFFKLGTMMTSHSVCSSGFDCSNETGLKVLGDGQDLIVCGYSLAGKHSKMLLLKTNGQYQTQWKNRYGIDDLDYEATSIVREWNGNYILAGTVTDKENNFQNIALLKTDPSGNQLWLREFHIPGRIENAVNVLQTLDGEIIITGNSGENLFFMRTTVDGIPL